MQPKQCFVCQVVKRVTGFHTWAWLALKKEHTICWDCLRHAKDIIASQNAEETGDTGLPSVINSRDRRVQMERSIVAALVKSSNRCAMTKKKSKIKKIDLKYGICNTEGGASESTFEDFFCAFASLVGQGVVVEGTKSAVNGERPLILTDKGVNLGKLLHPNPMMMKEQETAERKKQIAAVDAIYERERCESPHTIFTEAERLSFLAADNRFASAFM
jgi:hypothetical protein